MKRKNQKIMALISVLLIACMMFATGCTPAADTGASSEESAEPAGDKIVIGLSEPSSGWPYISAYMRAFEAAAAKNPDVEVQVLSADGDISEAGQ